MGWVGGMEQEGEGHITSREWEVAEGRTQSSLTSGVWIMPSKYLLMCLG